MKSIVNLPGAEWQLVTNVGNQSGLYSYDAINDEQGPRSASTRPCEHVRIRVSNNSISVPGFTIEVPAWPDKVLYTYVTTGGFCVFSSSVPERGDFAASVDSFNRRTVRSVVDEVPTSVSLPTFIGELPDIPRTVRSIRDLMELPFEGFNPRKFENFRELRAIKDRLSDPVLSWNFGVRPLWMDIQGFLSAQLGVNRAIERLRRTRGKVSKFKAGGTIKGTRYSDQWTPAGSVGPLGVEARWTGSSYCQVKAGGSFYHELGGLDSYAAHEAALRSSLGFDNLFKAAWDLVPFSFLADYVSNMGDLLSELKTNDAFTGDISLRDTWSTQKVVSEGSLEVRFRHPAGGTLAGGTMSQGSIMRFTRTQGIPTTAGLMLGGNLNARQLVNIAALV